MNVSSTPTLSPGYSKRTKSSKKTKVLQPGDSVVVLGAGSFGGWTALMLQERGLNVTLIDPWGPGNSRSSSGGESRLMRMVYGENQLYTELATRAYLLWERYQKLFGKRCLYPTGNLWLCPEHDTVIEKAIEILDDNNLPYARLDQSKAARQFPAYNLDDTGFILYEKKTGYLLARESTIAVRNYFVRKGGKYLRCVADIENLINYGDGLEISDGTRIKAHAYIVACGPWLPKLFPEWLSEHLLITRQDVHYFGVPQSSAPHLEAMPTWIDHTSDQFYYGIPNTFYRGLKIASDVRGEEIDPTSSDRSVLAENTENARAYLSHRFRGMQDAPLLESRVCQYTNTKDGNFIFDTHPTHPSIFALGGGSGHGFKHGPALGERVASVLLGEDTIPIDWLISS